MSLQDQRDALQAILGEDLVQNSPDATLYGQAAVAMARAFCYGGGNPSFSDWAKIGRVSGPLQTPHQGWDEADLFLSATPGPRLNIAGVCSEYGEQALPVQQIANQIRATVAAIRVLDAVL